MITKDINELTRQDFCHYSVWVYTNSIENEDEVTPLVSTDPIDSADEIYYITSKFTLPDHSNYAGYVRFAYGKVTFIALAIDEIFAEFSLVREIQESLEETAEDFAASLGKNKHQVFPLRFITNVSFSNQGQLKGTLEDVIG